MSTRQRSFFDQDHNNRYRPRARPNYNRTRSADNVLQTHAGKANANMAAEAIDPSSQSKKKLKAFAFVDGAPDTAASIDVNKENADGSESAHGQAPKDGQTVEAPVTAETANAKALPPSTPAPRLPLADLIGNNETQRRNTLLLATPEQDIQWRRGTNNATPGDVPSRKRKRTRSSSPATSSQHEHSRFFPDPRATERPSQNDDVLKIWDRATTAYDAKITPDPKQAAEFAHLIEKSSPRSSATAGSVSGLRRWASCGVEFPSATKPKKRRTTGAFRNGRIASGRGTPIEEDGLAAAASKVGRLLERMQETLAHPAKDVPPLAPSSSSPLPETGRFDQADEVSPLHRMPKDDEPQGEEQVLDDSPSGRVAAKLHIRGSSEFGDDDIDLDMVETIEARQPERVLSESRDLPGAAGIEADALLASSSSATLEPTSQGQQATGDDDDDAFDEFDGDDDILAADMEVAASMYDSRDDTNSTKPSIDHGALRSQRGACPHSDTSEALLEAAALANGPASAPPTQPAPPNVITVDSDDDFGGDDLDTDDLVAAEAIATQRVASGSASQPYQLRTIQRYLITKVVEGSYRDEHNRTQAEKILLVEDERRKLPRNITLRQAWLETPATEGSYVHVVGRFSSTGECVIDNSHNLLILHPDHLVSATTVADSFSCLRKAVLNIRVKATSDASPATLYGHMLHKLFQEAMKANAWDRKSLETMVEKMLPQYFETMAEIGLNENQVKDHMRSKFGELKTWASVFVRSRPTNESVVKDRNGKHVGLSIHKLLDVEENVESPKYGLKGMIDATVQVRMTDEQGERTLVVPFELKTGKRVNPAHQAQTMLYTLLTSDRYDLDVFYGILYYMESADMRRVPAVRHELLQMIMQRNQLARYMRDRLSLPQALEKSHLCGHCYAQTTCFVYHRLTEDGDGSGFTAAKQKFDELVRNLKTSHRDFFVMWDNLLTKEEAETMRHRRELWTMLSHEREKLGRCFAHVVIEPGSGVEQIGASKINRYEYTLVRQSASSGSSFTESQISVGEAIVISDEEGHFALAKGYVTNVRRKRITVSVDRRLHNAWVRRPNFDVQTNQDFQGIMEVPDDDAGTPTERLPQEHTPVLYRLDKDEFSNGMATVRNNLVALMDDNVFRSSDLRSLIIDDRAPVFRDTPSTNPFAATGSLDMNADQEAAVAKVMAAQDYALVLGMPGTGKTTTIAHIIRSLVARKKSVLLASYTHTAVDNILLKLRDKGFPILRVGAVAKIHPDVQDFAILAEKQKTSLQEVMESWHRPLVVATTCLGVNHALFSQRTFDYCIVDEASQITLPVCLGPIRMAKTFVLVGDHYQLPPLVQNKEALEGGYDVSLFRLLSERHPEAVTNLEHQYRMAEDVQLLANKLIYSGRLKCGTQTVAMRKMDVPRPGAIEGLHLPDLLTPAGPLCQSPVSRSCHLAAIVDSSRKVLFLNTDALLPSAAETTHGTRVTNALEARLTMQCVYALGACGVSASDLGVITFYRSQLALLRQSLRHLAPARSTPRRGYLASDMPSSLASELAGLEMHTADKFQGRDKEAVIVSFVRSNEACQVGELLKDWRRVNVAITRARSKLVLLGSKKTLAGGGNEVLSGLINICEHKGWIVDLDNTALDGHVCIDGPVSQTQAATGRALESPSPAKATAKNMATAKSQGHADAGRRSDTKRRQPLAAVEGTNRTPSEASAGKVPEKRGVIRQGALLNGRSVMRDLFNEML